MNRSAARKFADRVLTRPLWLEQDGEHQVLVRGYSPLDNLVFGTIAAAFILAPAIIFLVSHS